MVFGWSFPGTFVRLMPGIGPFQATILRVAIAFVGMLPILLLWRSERTRLGQAVRSSYAWGMGAVMLLYYLASTWAFQHAPVGEVALLIASSPALAILWRRISGSRIERREGIGVALAMLGVLAITLPAILDAKTPAPGNHLFGVALALVSALCACTYAFGIGRLVREGRSPGGLALSTLTFLLGALLTPLVFVGPPLKAEFLPYALGLGLLSTAIPTACYALAAERLPKGLITMFQPVTAVTASLVAALALGELPSIWVIPAGILVLAGLYLTLARKQEPGS